MIIRPNTLHQDTQAAPLLFKEGLGVVEEVSGPGTHHPLHPPPPRRGVEFKAGKRPEGGRQRAAIVQRCGAATHQEICQRRERRQKKEQVLVSVASVRSAVKISAKTPHPLTLFPLSPFPGERREGEGSQGEGSFSWFGVSGAQLAGTTVVGLFLATGEEGSCR